MNEASLITKVLFTILLMFSISSCQTLEVSTGEEASITPGSQESVNDSLAYGILTVDPVLVRLALVSGASPYSDLSYVVTTNRLLSNSEKVDIISTPLWAKYFLLSNIEGRVKKNREVFDNPSNPLSPLMLLGGLPIAFVHEGDIDHVGGVYTSTTIENYLKTLELLLPYYDSKEITEFLTIAIASNRWAFRDKFAFQDFSKIIRSIEKKGKGINGVSDVDLSKIVVSASASVLFSDTSDNVFSNPFSYIYSYAIDKNFRKNMHQNLHRTRYGERYLNAVELSHFTKELNSIVYSNSHSGTGTIAIALREYDSLISESRAKKERSSAFWSSMLDVTLDVIDVAADYASTLPDSQVSTRNIGTSNSTSSGKIDSAQNPISDDIKNQLAKNERERTKCYLTSQGTYLPKDAVQFGVACESIMIILPERQVYVSIQESHGTGSYGFMATDQEAVNDYIALRGELAGKKAKNECVTAGYSGAMQKTPLGYGPFFKNTFAGRSCERLKSLYPIAGSSEHSNGLFCEEKETFVCYKNLNSIQNPGASSTK
jgi:hypothetical protein